MRGEFTPWGDIRLSEGDTAELTDLMTRFVNSAINSADPGELIEAMKRHDFPESVIRKHMWVLIERGEMYLNDKWRFEKPNGRRNATDYL